MEGNPAMKDLKGSITLLIAAAMILFCGLSVNAQPQKLYAPTLAAMPDGDLGITLVNPTVSDARVVLTARSYNGIPIQKAGVTNPVTLTLPSLTQNAMMATEIFGQGISGQTGWIELSSSVNAVKGFFLVFDSSLTYLDGSELPNAPSNRVVFPKVSSSAASPTRLTLVNTSGQAIKGTVSLYDNGGHLTGIYTLSLAPLSGFSGSISELVPSGPSFEGYAVMDSGTTANPGPQALIGVETYRNLSDIALIRAFPETARLRTGYLAHLVSQGGYMTSLTLVNYYDQPQTLRITADGLQVNGSALGSITVERTLPAYGRLEERADRMFGFSGDALVTGYIRFDARGSTPGVIGVLEYGSTDGLVLSAVEAASEGYSDFYFSQVAETPDFYTGMVLLNATNDPSIVTIDNFNPAGKALDSTVINLQPRERQARLLSDILNRPMNQTGGYIRITSTRPIFAFQLFGSRNAFTFLASVPAQGVAVRPQISGRDVSSTRGAQVISTDGSTSLIIPPGALKANAPIKITPMNASTFPSPGDDQQPISVIEGTPDGTQFQIPVRLTFPLNADFDPGAQIPLQIYDPVTHKYTNTEFVAIVDNSHRTASAAVTHFTQYVTSTPNSKLLPVSSISPLTVLPGDTITITGSGFSTKTTQDVVTFAGPSNTSIAAFVQSGTATTIKATVPAGAISGPVIVRVGPKTSVGITVAVSTPNPAPGPISIAPSKVSTTVLPIDVQIAGTNFVPGATVNYDGAPISATYVDSTMLTITLTNSQLSPAVHTMDVSNPLPGGGTSNTAELTVVDSTANTAPIVDAGLNRVITLPAAVQLSGSTTDDGLPTGIPLTTTWTKVSGPGTVSFGNLNALSTTANFSVAGTYILRLTASDSLLTATDAVTIVVNPAGTVNQPPGVNAGTNQTITLPSAANLIGTASDDGLPNGVLNSTWSTLSGPGTVTFVNPNVLVTSAAFSTSGVYVLRLTATDSDLSASADVTITVNPLPNQAPVVSAGANQTITLPSSATLSGAATDDGLPSGSTLTITWSKVSGPATVTFGNINSPNTTATFSAAGSYVLRLAASDTALSSSSDVTITVNAGSTNQAPTVSAGPDQTISLRAAANLVGTATDDGMPLGSTLTKTWSKVSGPGNVTFANATDLSTTATFSAPGTYVLRLTASDTALIGTDDITVVVNGCGTVISGIVTILANATDDVGVVGVQFKLNGLNLGSEFTAAPYTLSWNTTTVANGCYTLSAVARDAAGSQGTAPALSVTVANP